MSELTGSQMQVNNFKPPLAVDITREKKYRTSCIKSDEINNQGFLRILRTHDKDYNLTFH